MSNAEPCDLRCLYACKINENTIMPINLKKKKKNRRRS